MEFLQIRASELYPLAMEMAKSKADPLPITPWRAKSQASNPAVNPDDILLIVARDKDMQVKGYIGLMPVQSSLLGGGRLFWNTCWWVAKDAGASVSMTLLSKFFKLTKMQVAFSDLGEHTVKLLSSFNGFILDEREGGIFRFRSAYHERSYDKQASVIKMIRALSVFRLLDLMMNTFVNTLPASQSVAEEKTTYKWKDVMEPSHQDFVRKFNTQGWIQPDTSVFEWWNDYPWLVERQNDTLEVSCRYYFSSLAKEFRIRILEARNKGELTGLAICSLRDGVLKTNFLYSQSGMEETLCRAILQAVHADRKIHSVLSFNPAFVNFMAEMKVQPAASKKRYTAYPDSLQDKLLADPVFQDGDGDYLFT